jgi:hypothetical protein
MVEISYCSWALIDQFIWKLKPYQNVLSKTHTEPNNNVLKLDYVLGYFIEYYAMFKAHWTSSIYVLAYMF